ncbi:MAG: hypothetical protein J07HX64_02125 [halophilic archaeon J07HX64]|jgi:hypothetical protein|nr:MAG: hypothetical protein J07HX64_02125 [halophilic archaeon J07HX64]
MADSKLVQIKVDSDRLEAWDKFHSENPEFDDRSDLVRKSVERTISTDNKQEESKDSIGRAEALEQFERLEGILNELEREVSLVQEDIVTEDTMDDIVLQRSFQSTKRVLKNAGIIGDENDSE